MAAVPIVVEDERIGVLGLCAARGVAFDDELMGLLGELAPALLWQADPTGDRIELNGRALGYLGQSPGELQAGGSASAGSCATARPGGICTSTDTRTG